MVHSNPKYGKKGAVKTNGDLLVRNRRESGGAIQAGEFSLGSLGGERTSASLEVAEIIVPACPLGT